MRRLQVLAGVLTLAVLSLSTTPTRAQGGGGDATIASAKTTFDVVKGYITKAAAQVPEDKYKYQATKDVRTMGQLFGHIANASAMICSMASGTKAAGGDAEKLATKAEIQKALADAFAVCDKAFTMITAANANETVNLFGMTHSRIGAMFFNAAHDFEHYGNIVTYMRLNGMVPPSTVGGGGD